MFATSPPTSTFAGPAVPPSSQHCNQENSPRDEDGVIEEPQLLPLLDNLVWVGRLGLTGEMPFVVGIVLHGTIHRKSPKWNTRYDNQRG